MATEVHLDGVKELVSQGKEKGWLTVDEIADSLGNLELSTEQVDAVYTLISEEGIEVVAQEPGTETEEIADFRGDPELLKAPTTDPVRMYLKEIGKVPLLTAEQEVDLAMRIEAGERVEIMIVNCERLEDTERLELEPAKLADELLFNPKKFDPDRIQSMAERSRVSLDGGRRSNERSRELAVRVIADGRKAKRQLVEANLRLVVSIAKRYVGRNLLFLDLIQEGNLGLIRAVEKFDYNKGFKFSTYATWWIRQAITRAIADQARTIRIPVHMVETINKLVRIQRQLLQDLGREPTADEIAEQMEMTPDKVREILKVSQEPVSLETPIGEEEDSHLGDFIEDSEAVIPLDAASFILLQEQLESVLNTLSERERRVIELRFGLQDGTQRTLEEVGKEFNVTRERIRQIESKTLSKLRHPSRSQKLRDYLE